VSVHSKALHSIRTLTVINKRHSRATISVFNVTANYVHTNRSMQRQTVPQELESLVLQTIRSPQSHQATYMHTYTQCLPVTLGYIQTQWVTLSFAKTSLKP